MGLTNTARMAHKPARGRSRSCQNKRAHEQQQKRCLLVAEDTAGHRQDQQEGCRKHETVHAVGGEEDPVCGIHAQDKGQEDEAEPQDVGAGVVQVTERHEQEYRRGWIREGESHVPVHEPSTRCVGYRDLPEHLGEDASVVEVQSMSRDLAVEVKTQEVPFVGSDERRDHRDAETEAQDGGARASAGGRRRCPGSGEGDPKECTEQQDAGGHFLHQQEARHRHAACRGHDPEAVSYTHLTLPTTPYV